MVNAAISKIVFEAQLKVLEDFKKFLGSKIDVDESMENDFVEFQATLKLAVPIAKKKGRGKVSSDDESIKKKRQPSLFNLFVKDKMTSLKAENPGKKGKEILTLASEKWNTDPFAIFLKDKMTSLKEENSDSDNETLYGKAKELFGDGVVVSSKSPVKKETKTKKGKKKAAVTSEDD